MNDRKKRGRDSSLDELFAQASEPKLNGSLYPGVRARLDARKRDSIPTPFRFAGGLAMAAGILLGVFVGNGPSGDGYEALESAGTFGSTGESAESFAPLFYDADETLDTAFLGSFTEEEIR